MPRFSYKAKKGPTEVIVGEIDAENEDAALGKITSLGLIPVKLESLSGNSETPVPIKTRTHEAPKAVTDDKLIVIQKDRVRIPYQSLHIFTRQFAILVKASVPLLKIFDVMQTQTENKKFRQILVEMQGRLREGAPLSETLGDYPKIFSQLYVNMVHSGEISGSLDKVLGRLAEFAEKEAEIRQRVQSALVYPVLLFLIGIATIFILLTFVMPRLMNVFADFGSELPALTQFMIKVSNFCQSYWIVMLAVVATVTLWLRMKGLSDAQKRKLDRVLVKLPLFGKLIEKAEIARFLRSLQLLYENGIPLYRAVEIASKTITNLEIRSHLEKVPTLLEGGNSLAKSLEQIDYVSSFVTNMIAVGEESGQLGAAVDETALFYEQETNQFIKIATSLLEPLMILIVGVVVGFIVIAMLLPIFEINVLAQ